MSTPPLLTMPTSSCIASVILSLTRVVGMTASPFTLEEQSFKWQGEAWSVDFRMPPLTKRSVASQWISFALNLQGTFGTFYLGDPSARQPRGVATGTPVVDGINQSGNTLLTRGWSNSVTGILLAGDYIQIGTGTNSRLHMVTADANSDSSGDASLSIVPALRSSPADGTAITVNNPVGVFRLRDNSWSWSVDPGPIYRLSFQAVEVVNA